MSKLITVLILIGLIAGVYVYFGKDKVDTKVSEQELMDIVNNTDMESEEMMTPVNYMDISVVDAKELIDNNPDLVIIDVSPKYEEGHIPGSINYYVGDGSLDEAIPTLDKRNKYLVYCHVDSASISGAEKLVEAGFENVYRLEGNYSAWVDAGYDIEQ